MRPLAALVLALAAALPSGCVVHARALVEPPEVVVFGPPVVVALPAHHAHRPGCGHPFRWHGGRRVYWASGRWEYVESGRLHVYQTLRSRPRDVAVVRPARPRPRPARPVPARPQPRRPEPSESDDDR